MPQKPPSPLKAGLLQHNDRFDRHERGELGGSPKNDTDDRSGVFQIEDEPENASEPALSMESAAVSHPKLDEPEMRPPPFLSRLQAMNDIYKRTRNRSSRRLEDLLQSTELEGLLDAVHFLMNTPPLRDHPEAKHIGPVFDRLKDDPGPMLIGLNDPRLMEPWRLFLMDWDIWYTDDETGIELFIEGEVEISARKTIPVSQVLRWKNGELELETVFGEDWDRVTFDGQSFYRLGGEKPDIERDDYL